MFNLFICFDSLIGSGTGEYLELLSEHPNLSKKGSAAEGEIELILEPNEIAQVEITQAARWVQKGFSLQEAKEASRVGVVAEDPYWIWIRDAVLFPSGTYGTYERLLWKSHLQDSGGVAVLPILPDGKILLNLNFRHATRSWEWEIPRGGAKRGEGIEDAGRREVAEETGWIVRDLKYLGSIACDSGCLGSIVPIYLGHLSHLESSETEDTEAIEGVYAFTFDELEKGLQEGTIENVPIRDPFLTYALLQVHLKK